MRFIPFIITTTSVALLALASCENPSGSKEKTSTSTLSKKDTAKKEPAKEEAPAAAAAAITFHVLTKKDSLRKAITRLYTPEQLYIIYALNRVDAAHSTRPDSLIVPDTVMTDIMAYSPFPAQVPFLKDVKKIVYFAYPIQAFAAYENGNLIKWGPSSMGKKATPTPTGLFFSNWKSKEAISTVDDEWKLKWNFNISNRGGVGWHQYAMPGYPASHSCLRMLEADAQYMYGWADQWVLKDANSLQANGTPTIVYGAYPFGQPRPWFSLLSDPKSNTVTVEDLQKQTESFLPKIMEEQQKRDGVVGSRAADKTVTASADTAKK
jgi:lipoprotein-anchoring transpeptidase ErfK/SrfK